MSIRERISRALADLFDAGQFIRDGRPCIFFCLIDDSGFGRNGFFSRPFCGDAENFYDIQNAVGCSCVMYYGVIDRGTVSLSGKVCRSDRFSGNG